jgi:hypothetical protein
MKQFVISAAVAMSLLFVSLVQPAMAAGGPYTKFAALNQPVVSENNVGIDLLRKDNQEIVCLHIENFGRKILTLSLLGPDGELLDAFVTGRKFVKMSREYNFTGAKEGVYSIVISGGPQEIKKQVKIEQVHSNPESRLTVQ